MSCCLRRGLLAPTFGDGSTGTVVSSPGLEPRSPALAGQCPNQLDHEDTKFPEGLEPSTRRLRFGRSAIELQEQAGAEGIEPSTSNPFGLVLLQLSYAPWDHALIIRPRKTPMPSNTFLCSPETSSVASAVARPPRSSSVNTRCPMPALVSRHERSTSAPMFGTERRTRCGGSCVGGIRSRTAIQAWQDWTACCRRERSEQTATYT